MSGEADGLVEAMADVIHAHRWTFGGGTASGAYWHCSCGAEGSARSGLREHADWLGAEHVAKRITAAIDAGIDAAVEAVTP